MASVQQRAEDFKSAVKALVQNEWLTSRDDTVAYLSGWLGGTFAKDSKAFDPDAFNNEIFKILHNHS